MIAALLGSDYKYFQNASGIPCLLLPALGGLKTFRQENSGGYGGANFPIPQERAEIQNPGVVAAE